MRGGGRCRRSQGLRTINWPPSPLIHSSGGVAVTTRLIEEAAEELGMEPETPNEFEGLSLTLHASFQGSFVMARGRRDTSVVRVVADQFTRSLRSRFGLSQEPD